MPLSIKDADINVLSHSILSYFSLPFLYQFALIFERYLVNIYAMVIINIYNFFAFV